MRRRVGQRWTSTVTNQQYSSNKRPELVRIDANADGRVSSNIHYMHSHTQIRAQSRSLPTSRYAYQFVVFAPMNLRSKDGTNPTIQRCQTTAVCELMAQVLCGCVSIILIHLSGLTEQNRGSVVSSSSHWKCQSRAGYKEKGWWFLMWTHEWTSTKRWSVLNVFRPLDAHIETLVIFRLICSNSS